MVYASKVGMKEFIQGAKYHWHSCAPRTSTMVDISRVLHIATPLVQTLETRGVTGADAMRVYLNPLKEDVVHDPSLLHDAVRAVERIEEALLRGEKILIAGDYDVDGVTSTALLLRCLVPLGAQINFFLPHRQRDGYGLSVHTVERAAAHGYRLIITVDNGITAHAPAITARHLGIDLIITDHHKPSELLPEAYAIVDPHVSACRYPFKYFAGVGVIFKLMTLLYDRLHRPLPDEIYELLTLGTIADVVPLIGENRYWIREGMRRINARESLAFSLLKRNAGLEKRTSLSSLDIGFYLTPQINALGRLDDARAAVGFLLSQNVEQVSAVGLTLASMNGKRKEVEREVVREISEQIESGAIPLSEHGVIVASGDSWPAGVVGLAAARLVGIYGRPAIVMHTTEDGIAKGSCRSIPTIDILDALHSVRDLLLTCGGHPMAAGVSLLVGHIPLFIKRLNEYVRSRIDIDALRQSIQLDAYITLPEVNSQLVKEMAYLEPFGAGNREPLFYIASVSQVQDPVLLKDAHVKCTVFADGSIKPIIFFNRKELFEPLRNLGNQPFHVAASIQENHWNGRTSVELQGVDVAFQRHGG